MSMKKIVLVLLALCVLLCMAGCGKTSGQSTKQEADSDSTSTESDYLPLTDDIYSAIEEKVADASYIIELEAILSLSYKDKSYSFSNLEISDVEKTDQYTVTAYGTVTAKNDSGEEADLNIELQFSAKEAEDEEDGYKISPERPI